MQRKNILVVDDDPLYLSLVKSIIDQCGLSSDIADGAKDALTLLQVNEYDLMMTDLHMPGLNGLDLSRMAHKMVPGLRIFLVSGDLSEDLRREARFAGVAEVHEKPCGAAVLRELVLQGAAPQQPQPAAPQCPLRLA